MAEESSEWGDPVHNPEAGQGTHAVPPFPFGDVPFKLAQQEKKWGDAVHNPEAGQGTIA